MRGQLGARRRRSGRQRFKGRDAEAEVEFRGEFRRLIFRFFEKAQVVERDVVVSAVVERLEEKLPVFVGAGAFDGGNRNSEKKNGRNRDAEGCAKRAFGV